MKKTMLVVLLFVCISLFADGVQPVGAGTSGDPYQIETLDNLLWVSTNNSSWNDYIIQTADINAADTQNWNSGAGFNRIGTSYSNDFEGNYDGQGFVIDSLFINRPSTDYIGFFGMCIGANISNLGITNADVTGENYVGIMVGRFYNSSIITNCYSTGNVAGTDQYAAAGGLIGNSYSSTINNCCNSGTVSGNYNSGGLIGYSSNSTINSCYNTGTVTTTGSYGDAGGLIGDSYSSTINNCYNTGTVTATGNYGDTGGLIGDSYSSTINNCYNSGTVSGNYNSGGLIGYRYAGSVQNSFWDTQTSGQNSSAGGSGRTTVQMQTMNTFTDAGWDFSDEFANGSEDIWGINATDNGAYPFLSWQGFVHNYSAPAGSGTEVDPYLVNSIGNLAWIGDNNTTWDSYFVQTTDISASSTEYWNGGVGFIPIGVDDTNPFTGNYDGQGYVIDGLTINKASGRTGLFGYTDNATISNLGVTNVDISAGSQTGGLVGYNSFSTITNCYTSGNVTGNWTTAGLVGRNNDSTILRCYSSVNVDAEGDHNGGLVGSNNSNSFIIDCYATGNVVGYDEDLGGLVGENNNNSEISNCYSTGNVSGGTNYVGGLVGRTLNGAITNNSFWDTETSGQSTGDGGTGKTTAEMQTQSTFTDAGWDFIGETTNGTDDYWEIFTYYNSGYPILNWNPNIPQVTTTTVSDITQTSAVSGGEVVNDGNLVINARGVCWNTSANPTTANSCTTDSTGTGVFTSELTGLTTGTTYYYRAYAANSLGTSYGDESYFITLPQGSGTSGDPYQISTLNELRWLSENSGYWNVHFIQTVDLDASDTQNWNSGEGFYRIGNSSNGFTGSYDGQGFIIDGLYIDRPSNNYQGIFGFLNNGVVTNLGATNVNITGNSSTGGLVGRNQASSIISNCYSTGSVSGNAQVGSLVGYSLYSTVTNCYTAASVSGSSEVGGLMGLSSSSTISNCYSTGSVSGSSDVGGLVGNRNSGSVNNSFWDMQTSGQSASDGGTGKTTAEMQEMSTFTDANWDFTDETANGTDDYWGINYSDNDAYPFLSWQGFLHNVYPCEGSGTELDPYLVDSHYDLIWISQENSTWDSYFLQTEDVDATSTISLNDSTGFSPIGNSSTEFSGNYDGQGFYIDGLFIYRLQSDEQALFGYTNGADISNVNVTNCDISGLGRTAGIVGFSSNNTLVNNCFASGTINADWTSGGIAGKNTSSVISQCYSTIDLYCIGDRIGGIVGYNNGGDIINCFSTGNVYGNSVVGGFVGFNDSGATITTSYSIGCATGNSNIGGFSGDNNATVTNSFWDFEASGNATGDGGTGKTTAEMQTIGTFTDAGWDFVGEFTNGSENIWYISYELEEYPQLTNFSDIVLYSVSDIFPDQGRQVMLQWNKANADTEYNMQNFYSVWRLRELSRTLPENAVIIRNPRELGNIRHSENSEIIWNNREDFWTFIDQVPAVMLTDYSYVAPTLIDSSAVLQPEDYTSTYKIMFHTEEELYQSPANSGYSVDNIAPNAVANVMLALNANNRNTGNSKKVSRKNSSKKRSRFGRNNIITLSWEEVTEGSYQGNSYPEQNGIWYRIYYSDSPDFICDEMTYHGTTQNVSLDIDVTGQDKMFFKIIVSDQE